MKPPWTIKIIENPGDLPLVEQLQRLVWPGSETDIVPGHLMRSAVHIGGLLIGAFIEQELVGYVFGFPGFYDTPDGPRLKHYSSMLGVHPDHRNQGIGFALKRAQWQMVRHQGIDRITWTFDPLLSQNAWLNITRLGAVCNTYLRDFYGKMRDGLNIGLPTDRFQVDWWVNSHRVNRRLSRRARLALDLAHFLASGAPIINPSVAGEDNLPHPGERIDINLEKDKTILLLEIPANFMALKTASIKLALEWRLHTRSIFEDLFAKGYLVTDFVYLNGAQPRSYYVMCYGESTL